jgi:protein lifeguard
MSNYPQPPPSYTTGKSAYISSDEDIEQPLLGGSPRAGPSGGPIYDQPAHGDVPDDFKVLHPATPGICFLLTCYLVWRDC